MNLCNEKRTAEEKLVEDLDRGQKTRRELSNFARRAGPISMSILLLLRTIAGVIEMLWEHLDINS